MTEPEKTSHLCPCCGLAMTPCRYRKWAAWRCTRPDCLTGTVVETQTVFGPSTQATGE